MLFGSSHRFLQRLKSCRHVTRDLPLLIHQETFWHRSSPAARSSRRQRTRRTTCATPMMMARAIAHYAQMGKRKKCARAHTHTKRSKSRTCCWIEGTEGGGTRATRRMPWPSSISECLQATGCRIVPSAGRYTHQAHCQIDGSPWPALDEIVQIRRATALCAESGERTAEESDSASSQVGTWLRLMTELPRRLLPLCFVILHLPRTTMTYSFPPRPPLHSTFARSPHPLAVNGVCVVSVEAVRGAHCPPPPRPCPPAYANMRCGVAVVMFGLLVHRCMPEAAE